MMSSLGNRTTSAGITQAVESIQAIGEMMRYTPDHKAGYAAALNVEKLAVILANVLTELNARLGKLEAAVHANEDSIAAEDMAYQALEEESNGCEFETFKPEASND